MSFRHDMNSSRSNDEAERPFWISYADLMTALMILFLVIMVTALASITKKSAEVSEEIVQVDEVLRSGEQRSEEIGSICEDLSDEAKKISKSISVDCRLNRISFGELGRFGSDEYKLGPEGEIALNAMVPVILDSANSPLGKKWMKQVLIEGYTDTDGSYLYNLNLSLKRSEWVMCTLLRNDASSFITLTPDQRRQIKKLFLAGGVAFNHVRDSKDASRRVELRLQFYGVGEDLANAARNEFKFADDSRERCHI